MSLTLGWVTAALLELLDSFVNHAPVVSSLWITFVGGCIGSFMNVVVYRLPAGMSLVHPGSRCPQCEHAIRARDNVPVVGWLVLRGRCRDCGAGIPIRYPAVEGLVATVTLALWLVDVVLPGQAVATHVRLGEFGLHALLVSTLICIALIDYDGFSLPWRIVMPAAAFLLIAAYSAPYLLLYLQILQKEMNPLPGLLAGAVCGAALSVIGAGADSGTRWRVAITTGGLTGAYLSWISISIVVGSVVLVLAAATWLRQTWKWIRWSSVFVGITTLYLIVEPLIRWPGPASLRARLIVLGVATVVALTALWTARPARRVPNA